MKRRQAGSRIKMTIYCQYPGQIPILNRLRKEVQVAAGKESDEAAVFPHEKVHVKGLTDWGGIKDANFYKGDRPLDRAHSGGDNTVMQVLFDGSNACSSVGNCRWARSY